MRRIKVLIVIPVLLPGGAEMLVRNMVLKGFGERFEIAICSLRGPLDSFIEKDLKGAGVRTYYLGMTSYADIRILYSLYRVFAQFRPHIVHSHLNSLLFSFIPSVLAHVPVKVHTVHNTASKESKAIFRLVCKLAFRLFNFFPIGISRTIGRTVEEFYGLRDVPVINNGIPTIEYGFSSEVRTSMRESIGLKDDIFTCVHVGRFFEQKNHYLLLRAFAKSLERLGDMALLLVGAGPLRNKAENLVNELGISGNVKFLGVREDVRSVLSASDLFVFSSDWEGLPITVIEAMAAGLPVVSTKVGGVPDLVKDGKTGYLVNRGDIDGLADSIIKIAKDRKLSMSMGEEAVRQVSENFDVSQTISGHTMLYTKLIEDHLGG